jgi:hypothetical protein
MAVSTEAITVVISRYVVKAILLAVETRYTILVSTVTARVTLIPSPASDLQQAVTHLRSGSDLTNRWKMDRIPEGAAAAEQHE